MTSSLYKPSCMLSQFLAGLIPASLVLYRLIYDFDASLAVLICRPIILASSILLFFLLWYGKPVTHAEERLVTILAVLCGVLLVPSLAATEPIRALQEWFKLVIMCAVAITLSRPLRHSPTAKILGTALVIASAIVGALIVFTYLKFMGPVVPTYAATRAFKGAVFNQGIPLNPVAFECVFSYISGMCLLRSTKFLWAVGLVLLLISSTLTGSRAPVAVLVMSGLVLIVLNALHSRRLLFRVAGWFLAAAMVMGAAVAITLPSFQELSAATEGRWDLWTVAVHKFTERPMLGYGYLSAEDDPGYIAGGYHNEYVTALAEQGVVGFTAVLVLFWYLLRRCWKLAFRPSHTWRKGQWALFGCLFLMFRALIELPGLFGSAQGPADFLAYIFLAIVVSQISREEDYLASEMRRPIQPPAPFIGARNFAEIR